MRARVKGGFKECEGRLRALEIRNLAHTLGLSDHTLRELGSIQPTCPPRLLSPLPSLPLLSGCSVPHYSWQSQCDAFHRARAARALVPPPHCHSCLPLTSSDWFSRK